MMSLTLNAKSGNVDVGTATSIVYMHVYMCRENTLDHHENKAEHLSPGPWHHRPTATMEEGLSHQGCVALGGSRTPAEQISFRNRGQRNPVVPWKWREGLWLAQGSALMRQSPCRQEQNQARIVTDQKSWGLGLGSSKRKHRAGREK